MRREDSDRRGDKRMVEAKISTQELRKRIQKVKTRGELDEIEEEIKTLMGREQDSELGDLVMEIAHKRQYFGCGCDPYKVILRKKGGCC